MSGPFLMSLILQLDLCLYKLRASMIIENDYHIVQDVVFLLFVCLNNSTSLLIICGIFVNSISKGLIIISNKILMLSEDKS